MSSTKQPAIAKIEAKTIIDLIASNRRMDERTPTDYRELKIEVGVIEKANGSAKVHLGKTKILVGVKVELGDPFPDTPEDGILTVNAELVPLASPSFEPGPPDENSIELARVVDRGIRESKAIDLKKLCIEPGKKVFVVFVDVYVLDHDGNLIDASALGALAAILNAKMRDYEIKDNEVIYKEGLIPLPIQNYPIATTMGKIGSSLVIDPSLKEEQAMTARLTVTIEKNGHICAMQMAGLGELSIDELKKAVEMAVTKSSEMRARVMEAAK
jgi:exosome complex component RRP42